ncbi:hypothetical protein, partial [Altererythrobacter sp.]|uniref:hypothetical protein n=1 Tax=Altererythrobacter sp. TaxID=1872480 RepID=UPI003D0297B3
MEEDHRPGSKLFQTEFVHFIRPKLEPALQSAALEAMTLSRDCLPAPLWRRQYYCSGRNPKA